MKKKTAMALATTLALAATAGFGTSFASAKTKACFVYIGPVGDFGWTYQHDQGRQAVEKALGDKVETAYLESVPESSEASARLKGWPVPAVISSSRHHSTTWIQPTRRPGNFRM